MYIRSTNIWLSYIHFINKSICKILVHLIDLFVHVENIWSQSLCGSRKYPYLPARMIFGSDPPTPKKFSVLSHTSLKNFCFETPSPSEFPMIILGVGMDIFWYQTLLHVQVCIFTWVEWSQSLLHVHVLVCICTLYRMPSAMFTCSLLSAAWAFHHEDFLVSPVQAPKFKIEIIAVTFWDVTELQSVTAKKCLLYAGFTGSSQNHICSLGRRLSFPLK